MSDGAVPALIGRRVAGKFVVEKLLGGGAMGAVYRARDDSLERTVALKVMLPTVAVDPSFVSRFHREARAASRLDHPSSMRVIEFGEEPDGLLYIAMEYLEGRDLYKVIHEDWPLAEPRIADVMMKSLGAIAVAHDMGVIHRDLKPENIMILDRKDDEGRDIVKVCDFGIAKITEKDESAPDAAPRTAGAKLTTAGVLVGTPEYMSPEQARGERLDPRSDIYSMGVILYQLLVGRTPFLAETALAVVLKHITDPPEPPSVIYPGVHKGLEAVALRALAKSKEERFQSARDMRAAIKAAIEGRPMPLESNAATSVDALAGADGSAGPPASAPPGAPTTGAGQGAGGTLVQPPPASALGSSKGTPLVAELTSPDAGRSRAPLVVAVALGAVVLGGAGVVLAQKLQGVEVQPSTTPAAGSSSPVDRGERAPPPPSSRAPRAEGAPPEGAPSQRTPSEGAPPEGAPSEAPLSEVPPSLEPSATATAPGSTTAPASPKVPASPAAAKAAANKPAPPGPASEPEPAPAPTAAGPTATPGPTPAPGPTAGPGPTAAPAPPLAPAFNAATCRATLGVPKSASGYNAKDLTLRGADAAWTSCARTTLKERPAGRVAGTVRIRFNDNRVFRGAVCSGCTPALAQCIATSTGKTASVSFKGGDQTGDPEFDVPVSFACD
ncbi:MAG: serine/threonine protein kinase [Labilithrix sp.]|nr:serine/threonine protein kinase [Labilithrix sp.]